MDINTWDHGEVHAQAAAEGNSWVHNPTAARICVEVHTYFLLSLKVVWMLCLGCHLRVSWYPRAMLLPRTCQSEDWFLSSVFNESTFKNFYGYVYVTTCVYVYHMCAGVYRCQNSKGPDFRWLWDAHECWEKNLRSSAEQYTLLAAEPFLKPLNWSLVEEKVIWH